MPRRKKEILDEIERRIEASDMLTDEEKVEARERARAHVEETRRKKAVEAYFDAAVKEEERSYVRDEQLEDFLVDLPEYTAFIALDNVRYWHGVTYEVPYSKARSMAEIQGAAWAHDREIHGRRRTGDMTRDPYNKGINQLVDRRMSMATGAVNTSSLEHRRI